ncbi:hypothetical protein EK21DRAFT_48496, partial [Setomelanomma holmii]
TPYKIHIKGQPFRITHNLYSALQELRLPDQERLLWVDAMSNNQYNNTEKGSQVQMMRDIYEKAERTIAWLGESARSTNFTFDFLHQFRNSGADGKDDFWKKRTNLPQWRRIAWELDDLLEYEWWKRAWIIQE